MDTPGSPFSLNKYLAFSLNEAKMELKHVRNQIQIKRNLIKATKIERRAFRTLLTERQVETSKLQDAIKGMFQTNTAQFKRVVNVLKDSAEDLNQTDFGLLDNVIAQAVNMSAALNEYDADVEHQSQNLEAINSMQDNQDLPIANSTPIKASTRIENVFKNAASPPSAVKTPSSLPEATSTTPIAIRTSSPIRPKRLIHRLLQANRTSPILQESNVNVQKRIKSQKYLKDVKSTEETPKKRKHNQSDVSSPKRKARSSSSLLTDMSETTTGSLNRRALGLMAATSNLAEGSIDEASTNKQVDVSSPKRKTNGSSSSVSDTSETSTGRLNRRALSRRAAPIDLRERSVDERIKEMELAAELRKKEKRKRRTASQDK